MSAGKELDGGGFVKRNIYRMIPREGLSGWRSWV
jgi:hypothetical protein